MTDAREKLLQNPLPIDRVAARVVKAARPENLWRPLPKPVSDAVHPGDVPATKPLPASTLRAAPHLADLIGKRRDRLRVVGYAAEQLSARHSDTRWVVRCDCGNYEYRKRIFRWLGTQAPDMCRECRVRTYKTRGEWASREPAIRQTAKSTEGPQ
jgi:hypothetical protein